MTQPAAAELPALGTSARIVISDPSALAAAQALMEDELLALDCAASRFRADSELRAAERAGGAPVRISALLAEAVAAALWASRVTDGSVDLTVGAALCAVGYDRDFAQLPRDGAARPGSAGSDAARSVSRPAAVTLDRERRTLAVAPGTRLDLGATAKALAADRIAGAVHVRTGADVLVSLGGDVATAGCRRRWAVAIEDGGRVVRLEGGGLATSATTARRWRQDGEERHHIIDPATQAPARTPWRTVSVAAGSCLAANTASTAAIVLGAAAPAWLAARRLPARLVTAEGRVLRVGGWPA